MYSSILSNIALDGSKTQFYFPFFCHSLRLLHLAWFVFKYKLLFLISPHSRGVGTYFCADPVSDDVSISVPLPQLPFLCECMISYELMDGCWAYHWDSLKSFLFFDDLDLIFKGTSYLKLSNLSPKVLVCMIFL